MPSPIPPPAPSRDDRVQSVGSAGQSYHNLRRFGPAARAPSTGFDGWLQRFLADAPAARTAALLDREAAPMAGIAHAQEDHLIPLHVALGAAEGDPATVVYHDEGLFGGVVATRWRFG